MGEGTVFAIGAVIFVVVSTAVFLYGLMWFRAWEVRSDELPAPDASSGPEA